MATSGTSSFTLDLTEIVETTNLDIKPKFLAIPKDDFLTVRKVQIISLPVQKDVILDKGKKTERAGKLFYMEINDNDVIYSLPANAVALRRSIIACAVKLSGAVDEKGIDLSIVLNKLLGIKRVSFTAKGFIAQSLIFFPLIE